MAKIEEFSEEETQLLVRQVETVAEILRAKLALAEARLELTRISPKKHLKIPPIVDTW
jgi:hypothetical protein